jgi:hypothetical protein
MTVHKVVHKLIVLDTSYLLELFQIPAHSDPTRFPTVSADFKRAINSNYDMYLPLPVLFELGNHIAQIDDGHARREKANILNASIGSWLGNASPISITPLLSETQSIEELKQALSKIAADFPANAMQRIGLVDTVVSMEASRLRSRHTDTSIKKYLVHIWTFDEALKAQEPDAEL